MLRQNAGRSYAISAPRTRLELIPTLCHEELRRVLPVMTGLPIVQILYNMLTYGLDDCKPLIDSLMTF